MLRKENKDLTQKLETAFDKDHYLRLRDSIAICLDKTFSDLESNAQSDIIETTK